MNSPNPSRIGACCKLVLWSLCLLLLAGQKAKSNDDTDANPTSRDRRKSGLELVYVKGGEFTMGGQDNVDDGGPKGGANADECPHTMTVRGYSLGKFEVTQADWAAIMGNNPSYFQGCSECPVEQVSWNEVQEYIRKLNLKTGREYRLPTEAEWEYAARGGAKSKGYRYSGSDDPNEVAWYRENSGDSTHPVGELHPNELGIHDMSGNIWEWCSDFKKPYPCDPKGKTFESKVLRGGTWSHGADSVRTKDRNARSSDFRLRTLGFRLANDNK